MQWSNSAWCKHYIMIHVCTWGKNKNTWSTSIQEKEKKKRYYDQRLCVYAYICVCAYIYVYMCVCVYMYVYMCVCVYIYVYMIIWSMEAKKGAKMLWSMSVHVCIHVCMCVCWCKYTYIYISIYILYIYINIYIYIYICTYVCKYTCKLQTLNGWYAVATISRLP